MGATAGDGFRGEGGSVDSRAGDEVALNRPLECPIGWQNVERSLSCGLMQDKVHLPKGNLRLDSAP